MADVVYLRPGNTKNSATSIGPGPGVPVDTKVHQDLKAWMVTGAVGYSEIPKTRMDVLGGLRYLTVDVDAELSVTSPLPPTPPPAKVSASETLWDGIIGVRGRVELADHWYLPYFADIGAGDSDLT